MKKSLWLTCLGIVCLVSACNDDDNRDEDLGQTTSEALTFECSGGIQRTHLADQSVISMSCENYGGCDSAAKKCVNAPKLASTESGCAASDVRCVSDIRYMCSSKNWVAVQKCEAGCNNNGFCNPDIVCSDNARKCENDREYVCLGNSWGDGTPCSDGCAGDMCKVDTDCTDGDTKCEDSIKFSCMENKWWMENARTAAMVKSAKLMSWSDARTAQKNARAIKLMFAQAAVGGKEPPVHRAVKATSAKTKS